LKFGSSPLSSAVSSWPLGPDRSFTNVYWFVSYSTKDHIFAELASIKLTEAGIDVWRDQGLLRAGGDWRNGIERGIANSSAVLVVLSLNSVASPYVTFEWAYALGKGKTVIPIRLEQCNVHPRLEPIQYLDFSVHGALPWNLLVERIREVEAEATSEDYLDDLGATEDDPESLTTPDFTVTAILNYLNQRGYQMVSYDRLRRRIDAELTDQMLNDLVDRNPQVFRHAIIKEQRPGLAKRIP
jgi:hypothetical protein